MTVRGGVIIKECIYQFLFQRNKFRLQKSKPKDKPNIVKEEIKFRNIGPT